MSGSSAMASARRRRVAESTITVPEESKPTIISKSNIVNNDNIPKQSMKPLEILQIHDSKLRTIEDSMEEKIIELSKVVLRENLKHIVKEVETIKINNNSLRDELSASIRNTNASVSFDSSPLVEKISTLSDNYDELKTLLIKSQQQSIDTYSEMLMIRERGVFLENRVSDLESMIGDTSKNETGGMFDMGQGGGVAEMLRSMMESSMADNSGEEVLNIHENDCDDATELYDMDEINRIEDDLVDLKLLEENLDGVIDNTSQNELIDISDREDEPLEDAESESREVVVSLRVADCSQVFVSVNSLETSNPIV